MSHRPLVLFSGLTFADYLLWNWSLNHNHDVLALVSGLTLPPLAVGMIWMLTLTVARLIARLARARTRSSERLAKRPPRRAPIAPEEPAAGAAQPSGRSRSKLAA